MSTSPAPKKAFTMQSSKLASFADQLWESSKNQFRADQSFIKLDLGQKLGTKKAVRKIEEESTPRCSGFIFGAKLGERVIINEKELGTKKEEKKDNGGSSAECSRFMFGSKLEERVTVNEKEAKKVCGTSVNVFNEEDNGKDCDRTSISDIFQAARRMSSRTSSFAWTDNGPTTSEDTSKSIIDKEAISSSAEATGVITGEEGEDNIFNVRCTLHSFDVPSQKWLERGLVNLRINQLGCSVHRIVARSEGNKRVLLNSRVSSDMFLARIGPKRVEFSASCPDSDLPQLFLATASEFTTEELYNCLNELVLPKQQSNRKRKNVDV